MRKARPLTRSEIMARIRAKDTRMEVSFRRALWRLGLRFRKHYGRPSIDVAFPGRRVAIMLDGCFWHGCPTHGTTPKTRRGYWVPKLRRNRERDRLANQILREEGWIVARVWECEAKCMMRDEAKLRNFLKKLGLM